MQSILKANLSPETGRAKIKAERARRSFREFVYQAWPLVEPTMPLRPGWHLDAICDHLQAVSDGGIRRLLINIPPGLGKSLLVSVLWPSWVWARNPGWRSIFSSYSHDLVVRDAVRARNLMMETWFQEAFVEGRWQFSDDMNRKDMYTNTRTGRRISLSVGSQATGFRGNCIAIDDPLNAKDAPSKVKRDACLFWFDQVMQTRVDDPSRDSFVVIMQRLHEEDLSGHILARGGYEHLCLPAEFVGERKCVTYFKRPDGTKEKLFEDPRTREGEVLFPALHPQEILDARKKELGSVGYAGQFGQSPGAAEGGLFKYAWWRFWKHEGTKPGNAPRPRQCWQGEAKILPKFHQIIGSLDAAFKETEESDYVVFTVWGIYGVEKYLLDIVRGRMDFSKTQKTFIELAKKHPQCRKWLVEDKANGPAIVTSLKAIIPGIVPVTPEGGKEARAAVMQPFVEAGQVYLPDGAPWVQDYVDEFAVFPNGKHDDQIDSSTQMVVFISANPEIIRAMMLVSNM